MTTDKMACLNLVAVVTCLVGIFGGGELCADGHYLIGIPVGFLAPLSWMFIRVNCSVIKERDGAEKPEEKP